MFFLLTFRVFDKGFFFKESNNYKAVCWISNKNGHI